MLELDRITKRFGTLVANDDVTLTLAQGELLALLGENGAGKTTLMNILFGHYTADAGEVRVIGHATAAGRPRAAIEAGVGMVHQHFTLAANLTVLENVMIGTEPLWRADSHRAQAARAKLAAFAERFGLPVHPDARIGDLSVGERQRVEILKALYRDAQRADPRRTDRRARPGQRQSACSTRCAAWRQRGFRSSSSATSCTR